MSLRVLHVTPYYERAWGFGGIPRASSALARGLATRGHQVTVCTTDACDDAGRLPGGSRLAPWKVSEDGGVQVRVFPNLSNRLAYARQFFVPLGMRAFLREQCEEHDIAHVHGHHHLPSVLTAAAARRAGIPYVVTPHGLAPRAEGQRLAKWVFDMTVGRGVLHQANRILAVSEAERVQLAGLGVSEGRLRVVPNPLDLEAFSITPPRGELRRRFAGFDQFVLYLGTLITRKCVDVLVSALPLLARRRLGLVIAGNDLGAGPQIRRAVRRLGLEDQVRFLGLVVGPDRAALLADADVVAYAGREEVFGLVPLEALLCETPVVVANDSGCGEVIRSIGGGLLVPPGEAAPLAAALAEILSAPESWRRAARGASAAIRERFTVDGVAAAVEAQYLELLGDTR